jgi:hypothetical protein
MWISIESGVGTIRGRNRQDAKGHGRIWKGWSPILPLGYRCPMPLTIAHPAAILPLRRWAHALGGISALAIGSVAPDIPYFVPLPVSRTLTHSPAGLLAFSLPAGLVAWLIFEFLVKDALAHILPGDSRIVAGPKSRLTSRRAALACGGILIGAASHIAWDSFTHRTGYMVVHHELLRLTILEVSGRGLQVYKFLQHASTVLGLTAIAWIIWSSNRREFPRRSPGHSGSRPRLSWTFILMVVAAFMLVQIRRTACIELACLPKLSGSVFVAGVRGLLLAVLLCAIASRLLDHPRR